MAWMWWAAGLVLVGETVRAVVADLVRSAPASTPSRPSISSAAEQRRLAELDRAIADTGAELVAAERDGELVATVGALSLSTRRIRVGDRSLPVGPGLRISVGGVGALGPDLAATGGAPRPETSGRSIHGFDGTVIALPRGAVVATSSTATWTPRSTTTAHPDVLEALVAKEPWATVTVTVTDGGGDDLRIDLPARRAPEAIALVAHLDELLALERAVLEARRGLAVSDAACALAALHACRAELVGPPAPPVPQQVPTAADPLMPATGATPATIDLRALSISP